MRKFNKASLVIAPMALMLFSSSLNIPKVVADESPSWSDQEQINQQSKYNQQLIDKYKNYTTKELFEYLSKVESTIPEIITSANDGFKKDLDYNYNNEKNKFNNCKANISKFDLNNKNKYYVTSNLNIWILHYHGNNDINNRINDLIKRIDSNSNDLINDEQLEQIKNIKLEYLNFLDSSLNNLENKYTSNLNDLNKEIDTDKGYSKNALSYATKYQKMSELGNDTISTKDMNYIKNVLSDYSFATMNIKSYQYVKNDINTTNKLRELESYLMNLMRTSIDESSKPSISLNDEINNLKNKINSINNKSSSSYVPISNNSNVNNNSDELKNDLNNAKNNINNIINKNVELSNTTNSLKNEIKTLKQQVHDLNNNKKSKHKKNKVNKRALNQKRKELNKVNKELKKHIRKSNKKKLIQKRNSILKSIKKLNK